MACTHLEHLSSEPTVESSIFDISTVKMSSFLDLCDDFDPGSLFMSGSALTLGNTAAAVMVSRASIACNVHDIRRTEICPFHLLNYLVLSMLTFSPPPTLSFNFNILFLPVSSRRRRPLYADPVDDLSTLLDLHFTYAAFLVLRILKSSSWIDERGGGVRPEWVRSVARGNWNGRNVVAGGKAEGRRR
ncbi:unnamed protein product [Zymoseptoria tritici ST99CH_1A5]|uniref:Uncharacterized protein n=1 Tax=Zymoseptoria tritici ST99CH_1A5 TaxID=1276529 RepID=A0A1Y6M150_ZYMTR|nr:unnamed protein product [Zymoseptoria tritici ST99CH_3D1]SMY30377.1 unnamed protein product [Zymoseptoria tritici ST99CH_1A5]